MINRARELYQTCDADTLLSILLEEFNLPEASGPYFYPEVIGPLYNQNTFRHACLEKRVIQAKSNRNAHLKKTVRERKLFILETETSYFIDLEKSLSKEKRVKAFETLVGIPFSTD